MPTPSSPLPLPTTPIITLTQQNLIPLYLIQDNLKSNFSQIQTFITSQSHINASFSQHLLSTQSSLSSITQSSQKRLTQIQQTIFNSIKTEIEGTVTLVINKHLSTVLDKVVNHEQREKQKEEEMNRNIEDLEKRLKYEIAQENQKFFVKEIQKIEKGLQKKVQTIINDHLTNPNSKSSLFRNNGFMCPPQQPKPQKPKHPSQPHSQSPQRATHHNQSPSQQDPSSRSQISPLQLQSIKNSLQQVKSTLTQLSDYRSDFQKFYAESIATLKASWRELGTELLDNKKLLNRKCQALQVDLIRLRNLAEFKPLTETSDEQFKRKILQKFNDFSGLMSSLTSKTEFQMSSSRFETTLTRFQEQLSSVKEKFQKNTEYFTFYTNNANTEDLKASLTKIKTQILEDKKYVGSVIEGLLEKDREVRKVVEGVVRGVGEVEGAVEAVEGKLGKVGERVEGVVGRVEGVMGRVEKLEGLNNIDGTKMKRIHDVLDMELSFPQHHDIDNSRSGQSLPLSHSIPQQSPTQKLPPTQSRINKQLQHQIQQLKDHLFLLSSQRNMSGIQSQDEIIQLKNQFHRLSQKLQKIKSDTQEQQLSRKPWIVVNSSTERNGMVSNGMRDYNSSVGKELQHKDPSRKKISLEIGKSGGFLTNSNRNSQKLISPSLVKYGSEEKFEVYEKYREKYLSDTLKLPEIFKEKLGVDEFFK